MIDNNIFIPIVSAGSALLGVIVSQIITAINSKSSDHRKHNFEIIKTKLARKIEVGESFYYISGENLQLMKAMVHYIKTKSIVQSKLSKEFLQNGYTRLHADFEKIKSDNHSANLINLYFNVGVSFELISKSDLEAKNIFLNLYELNSEYSRSTNSAAYNERLAEGIAKEMINLCNHFEKSIERTKEDMDTVAQALNNF